MGHVLRERGVQADVRENQKEGVMARSTRKGNSPATALQQPKVALTDAHSTAAGEWETTPRGLDGILCALEQLPREGLGQGLSAMQ